MTARAGARLAARAADSCSGGGQGRGRGGRTLFTAQARAPRRGGAGRRAPRWGGAGRRAPGRVRRACWSGSRGLLAGRQVMRVTMATHQRKCILQETLIPSPRSWDSLTFHSHTVIRYQLSVQGGRLRGCSPAWGGRTNGAGGTRRDGGVKDTGTLGGGGPGRLASPSLQPPGARPLTWRPRPRGLRPPHAHLLRARPPALRPPSGPANPLPAHLPCPAPRDAAHLSFVQGGTIRSCQLSFRERPLCARRRAKPDLP